jgi:hypothetical protein
MRRSRAVEGGRWSEVREGSAGEAARRGADTETPAGWPAGVTPGSGVAGASI